MGSPNAFGRWPQQWTYIIGLITTASATPGNALFGIKTIVRNKTPLVEQMPAIGVQWMGSDIVRFGQRQRQTKATFTISVACVSEYDPNNPDTASQALSALLPFINDQLGGGLEPMLGTLETLGGIASGGSLLTGIKADVLRTGATAQSEGIAYADFTLEVYDQVKS